MKNSDNLLLDEFIMSGVAAGYARANSQNRSRANAIDRQALGSFIMSSPSSRKQTESKSAQVSQERRQAQPVTPVKFSSVKKQALSTPVKDPTEITPCQKVH